VKRSLSFFLSVSILGSLLSLAETILLKNGNRLEGEVLKKSEKHLFLDVGFDVLNIPSEAISEIEEAGVTEDVAASEEELVSTTPSGQSLFSKQANAQTRSVKENAEIVGEAVVQIGTPSGLGSGFVIHPDGYVITNNHVIAGEHKITIMIFRQTSRELEKIQKQNVKILATSPVLDLALLKIEGEESPDFAHVPVEAGGGLRSGQPVFAIGSPLGLGRSVSQGIVSVRNRVISGGLFYIQHTAEINSGNSGGPLFNLQGEVVGVLNMKMVQAGVEGLGFAIPASLLRLFLENQDAYAFDPRNPNAGFRYLDPPGAHPKAEDLPVKTGPAEDAAVTSQS
jgi:serine protease Do